jgi:hypothetical protein
MLATRSASYSPYVIAQVALAAAKHSGKAAAFMIDPTDVTGMMDTYTHSCGKYRAVNTISGAPLLVRFDDELFAEEGRDLTFSIPPGYALAGGTVEGEFCTTPLSRLSDLPVHPLLVRAAAQSFPYQHWPPTQAAMRVSTAQPHSIPTPCWGTAHPMQTSLPASLQLGITLPPAHDRPPVLQQHADVHQTPTCSPLGCTAGTFLGPCT